LYKNLHLSLIIIAPLAPIFDKLLLKPLNGFRILQNLGGIANACIISSEQSFEPIYFDSGPANGNLLLLLLLLL
jgi:1,6-anhydro-N-acetylmuramate kinase